LTGLAREAYQGWPVPVSTYAFRLPTNRPERDGQPDPIGWLLDNLVMKKKLTSTLDDVFAALVRHAEASR
jgi:hypothetical protein